MTPVTIRQPTTKYRISVRRPFYYATIIEVEAASEASAENLAKQHAFAHSADMDWSPVEEEPLLGSYLPEVLARDKD